VDYLQRRLVHPAQRIQQQSERLSALNQRMRLAYAFTAQHQQGCSNSLLQRLRGLRPNALRLREQQVNQTRRLNSAVRNTLDRHAARLLALQQHLQLIDPQQVLARGYSMVRDSQGNIVVDSANIALGERLEITFAQGGARAVVQEKSGVRAD
jgi:exodeoxyribonuclease VII large subunit